MDGSPSKTARAGWSFDLSYKRTVSAKKEKRGRKSPGLASLLPVVCSVVASPPFIYDESVEAEKCGK